MKKWYATGALPELVDIREKIHLDDHIYFTSYTVHCIKYWYPTGENSSLAMYCLTRALQAQWIQAYINFANCIVCRISIIVHESYLQWLVLQLGIVNFKPKPMGILCSDLMNFNEGNTVYTSPCSMLDSGSFETLLSYAPCWPI